MFSHHDFHNMWMNALEFGVGGSGAVVRFGQPDTNCVMTIRFGDESHFYAVNLLLNRCTIIKVMMGRVLSGTVDSTIGLLTVDIFLRILAVEMNFPSTC